ncbi:NADH:flavin oxidoreductase [Rhodococcus triatomae]|uniref:NADH:flavin oxidoreductase n=1 Tax=Rhodococcus triatomae TaxID=300028 RepID=UPI000932CFF3|nr:NADH:flavin oxidoreductase [Rhodococcus triatomae]QNG20087.1 NADH:flavin oxidoreductase [Rhodococcus triatomae]QNG23997.1 NADH:flavin oxidoreductase [Rhodococcus triatomae]
MADTDPKTDSLFEPFAHKSLKLRNRFAMAPMTRGFSPNGIPGEDVAAYYRRRAAGGVGLIITEGTYIPDPAAGPMPSVPRLYSSESLEGWRRVVDEVHAEGGVIIPQLWHTGVERGERPRFNPDVPTVSPSGIALDGSTLGRAFETAELDTLLEAWVAAAVNAKDVGFDGIELHGAHGYLLDEFLWDRTNVRDDGYGGSLPARVRFPVEVVSAIRAAVGPEFAIVYRFSQWKSNQYDARIANTPTELEQILTPLVDAGVDILHPSTRRHWEPAFEDEPGRDGTLGLAGWTKRLTGVPTITVGSVGLDRVFTTAFTDDGDSRAAGLEELVRQYENGDFDLVAVGRALISDPQWVRKLQTGRTDEHIPFSTEHRKVLH